MPLRPLTTFGVLGRGSQWWQTGRRSTRWACFKPWHSEVVCQTWPKGRELHVQWGIPLQGGTGARCSTAKVVLGIADKLGRWSRLLAARCSIVPSSHCGVFCSRSWSRQLSRGRSLLSHSVVQSKVLLIQGGIKVSLVASICNTWLFRSRNLPSL